jgi:hypothetical protein
MFWNCVYGALYLPLSILLNLFTGQGDILGILLVGTLCSLLLTVYLLFQDECLFETWEPAIVHHIRVQKPVQEVEPDETIEEKPLVVIEPAPKIRTDVDLRLLDADDDDILG